jgi:hypothetical protein
MLPTWGIDCGNCAVTFAEREPAAPVGCGSRARSRGVSKEPAAQSIVAATERGAAVHSRGDRE